MIFVTHALPVNVAGEPELDRSAVWDGLVPIEMGGRDGYYHNETFHVRVPPEAEAHPIWRIVDEPVRNRQILAQMPQFYGTNQGDRLKPAATALGFCDRPIGSSGVMPIFSCEPFGRGRTLAMLTDSTAGWLTVLPASNSSRATAKSRRVGFGRL